MPDQLSLLSSHNLMPPFPLIPYKNNPMPITLIIFCSFLTRVPTSDILVPNSVSLGRMSMMVEVRVPNLDCEGCVSKLKRALFKLKGVEEVEVDMEIQKLTVRGYRLEEKKVLKAVRRAGKAAEPWPFPGHSHFASFYQYPSYIVSHYYETHRAGGTHSVHTFFHTPAVYSTAVASDEAFGSIFSDDNPNACSIM